MNSKWATYQALELISDREFEAKYPKRSSWLTRLFSVTARLMSSFDEPEVWHVKTLAGHDQWRVYDPLTRRSATFGSEAEIRIWLEQRYYQ